MSTGMYIHLAISLAVLIFCVIIFMTGGESGRTSALSFVGIMVGYWFGLYTPIPNGSKV